MPSLGFLKKKRTRDSNATDTNSSSNPTSPVTPTSTKSFSISKVLGGARRRSSNEQKSSEKPRKLTNPTPERQLSSPQTVSQPPQEQEDVPMQAAEAAPPLAMAQPQMLQQQQQQPQPMQPPSPSGADAQKTPSISNLIHPTNSNGNAPTAPYPVASAVSSQYSTNNNTSNPQLHPVQQDGGGGSGSGLITSASSQSQMELDSPTPQRGGAATASDSASIMTATTAAASTRATRGKYTLTDFDVLRTLGTGSFGRVHLVQSKHNQRFYAVKVLKKAQVVKMKQVEHTNDERKMLGEVKHPFLITLWGTFQDARNLYMVMDFVEGGELFSLLRKSGRFPNPVAKFYAAEVTLALEYLHSKDIIYRDLKPENLLLDRHGHLKITDFGFAKRVPDKTWTLCGTPDYLAPEVVSNKGYNKSVDWWSLGILIYEMLCGYTPFWDGGSPMRIYENILRGKVKYPAYVNPDAQDLLERLITADLTKRLGNLYGGSEDVKSHRWFTEVTWDRLARKDIDAPYTPPVRGGAGDASQFDRYPEETERYGVGGHDEFAHFFLDF